LAGRTTFFMPAMSPAMNLRMFSTMTGRLVATEASCVAD